MSAIKNNIVLRKKNTKNEALRDVTALKTNTTLFTKIILE